MACDISHTMMEILGNCSWGLFAQMVDMSLRRSAACWTTGRGRGSVAGRYEHVTRGFGNLKIIFLMTPEASQKHQMSVDYKARTACVFLPTNRHGHLILFGQWKLPSENQVQRWRYPGPDGEGHDRDGCQCWLVASLFCFFFYGRYINNVFIIKALEKRPQRYVQDSNKAPEAPTSKCA